MPETTCFYSFQSDEKESSYFELDTDSISFRELESFLISSNIIDKSFAILNPNTLELIDSDEKLQSLIPCNSNCEDSVICLLFAKLPLPSQEEKNFVCEQCKSIISGVRFQCLHCEEFILCSVCENDNLEGKVHDISHIFAKLCSPDISLPVSFSKKCARRDRHTSHFHPFHPHHHPGHRFSHHHPHSKHSNPSDHTVDDSLDFPHFPFHSIFPHYHSRHPHHGSRHFHVHPHHDGSHHGFRHFHGHHPHHGGHHHSHHDEGHSFSHHPHHEEGSHHHPHHGGHHYPHHPHHGGHHYPHHPHHDQSFPTHNQLPFHPRFPHHHRPYHFGNHFSHENSSPDHSCSQQKDRCCKKEESIPTVPPFPRCGFAPGFAFNKFHAKKRLVTLENSVKELQEQLNNLSQE